MPDQNASMHTTSRIYRRPFAKPLRTARGEWSTREGILVRIVNTKGIAGYGEIAPLPEFGSETLQEAVGFTKAIDGNCSRQQIERLMAEAPPATAFGLWSALQHLDHVDKDASNNLKTASVFPLDASWERSLDQARSSGTQTLKVKMGLQAPETERDLLGHLLDALSSGERIRLDPNMSWDMRNLNEWVDWLSRATEKVEYIEEPLRPGSASIRELSDLARENPIPLALDESISRDGLSPWLEAGWPGYWVIKPSLLGLPTWIDKLEPQKVVLSSVFETGVGMTSIIALAKSFAGTCHGMGTGDYFDDKLSQAPSGGKIRPFSRKEVESVWKALSHD